MKTIITTSHYRYHWEIRIPCNGALLAYGTASSFNESENEISAWYKRHMFFFASEYFIYDSHQNTCESLVKRGGFNLDYVLPAKRGGAT